MTDQTAKKVPDSVRVTHTPGMPNDDICRIAYSYWLEPAEFLPCHYYQIGDQVYRVSGDGETEIEILAVRRVPRQWPLPARVLPQVQP